MRQRGVHVAVARRAGTVAGPAPLLRPPTALVPRLQWVFLLFAIFCLLGVAAPQAAVEEGRGPTFRAVVVVLCVATAASWVHSYRRTRFAAATVPLELITIALLVAGPDSPLKTVGVLYGTLMFRALYGSWRQALTYLGLATVAFLVGVVFAAQIGVVFDTGTVLQAVPGAPVLGAVVHLVAVASAQAERAMARERVLGRAGIAIAVATDAAQVRRDTVAAVREITGEAKAAQVRVVLRAEPPPPPPTGVRLGLPLRGPDGVLGDLLVDTAAPLPDEVRDALEVVGAQLALGLQASALTADLHHRATHDALTDLPNRRLLDDTLRRALDGPDQAALMLLDLDGFKGVNDRLGHAIGDALLRAVAERLRAAVRAEDLVARLGGDEFVVLLLGEGAGARAAPLVERLGGLIAEPLRLHGHTVCVQASIGMALTHPGQSADDLLRSADLTMYGVKELRRTTRSRGAGAPVP